MNDKITGESISYLSGHEFAAKVGVASGLNTYLKFILFDESVKDAIDVCKTNNSNYEVLLNVIKEYSSIEIDENYISPWDTFLSALVLIIYKADKKFINLALDIVSTAPQLWWCEKISDHISQIESRMTFNDIDGSDFSGWDIIITKSVGTGNQLSINNYNNNIIKTEFIFRLINFSKLNIDIITPNFSSNNMNEIDIHKSYLNSDVNLINQNYHITQTSSGS